MKSAALTAAGVAAAGALSSCSKEEPKRLPTVEEIAHGFVQDMTLEQKVAQLFIVTPEQLTHTDTVLEAGDVVGDSLAAMPVAGIIFFAANVQDSGQTRSLLLDTQQSAIQAGAFPLFLCIDEEGGTVQRIGGHSDFDLPPTPNASDIGATQDVEIARRYAHQIASKLLELGFNTDFAPSCDIASSPESTMRLRSFGAEADVVAEMSTAQIEAFIDEGVLCCAKHFPGIGDPDVDSHNTMIQSSRSREELEEQLVPFQAAIDVGVPLVMMGHLSLPQVTGSMVPSSLSPQIVQGILREDMGYDGVIISDSLGMGALREFVSPEDVGIAAIEAGCDIALMPPDLEAAYDALLEALETGRIAEERIDESLVRIVSLKLRSFPDLFYSELEESILAFFTE